MENFDRLFLIRLIRDYMKYRLFKWMIPGEDRRSTTGGWGWRRWQRRRGTSDCDQHPRIHHWKKLKDVGVFAYYLSENTEKRVFLNAASCPFRGFYTLYCCHGTGLKPADTSGIMWCFWQLFFFLWATVSPYLSVPGHNLSKGFCCI